MCVIFLYLYCKDKKKTEFSKERMDISSGEEIFKGRFFAKIIVDFFRLILLSIVRTFDDDQHC